MKPLHLALGAAYKAPTLCRQAKDDDPRVPVWQVARDAVMHDKRVICIQCLHVRDEANRTDR